MLYPLGFYCVKKTKRFVILSPDKSSERNLSCFDTMKPKRIEHLQKEEPFSSDPYFSTNFYNIWGFAQWQFLVSWIFVVWVFQVQFKTGINLERSKLHKKNVLAWKHWTKKRLEEFDMISFEVMDWKQKTEELLQNLQMTNFHLDFKQFHFSGNQKNILKLLNMNVKLEQVN